MIIGKIVGAIMAGHDGRRGYIYHTAVLPDYRKQGIGRKLVESAVSALEEGINKAALVAFAKNEIENGFWENIQYISSKMALFIRAMMDSGEYNECDYGMVIDVFQLLPQHFIQHIDSSLCDFFISVHQK